MDQIPITPDFPLPAPIATPVIRIIAVMEPIAVDLSNLKNEIPPAIGSTTVASQTASKIDSIPVASPVAVMAPVDLPDSSSLIPTATIDSTPVSDPALSSATSTTISAETQVTSTPKVHPIIVFQSAAIIAPPPTKQISEPIKAQGIPVVVVSKPAPVAFKPISNVSDFAQVPDNATMGQSKAIGTSSITDSEPDLDSGNNSSWEDHANSQPEQKHSDFWRMPPQRIEHETLRAHVRPQSDPVQPVAIAPVTASSVSANNTLAAISQESAPLQTDSSTPRTTIPDQQSASLVQSLPSALLDRSSQSSPHLFPIIAGVIALLVFIGGTVLFYRRRSMHRKRSIKKPILPFAASHQPRAHRMQTPTTATSFITIDSPTSYNKQASEVTTLVKTLSVKSESRTIRSENSAASWGSIKSISGLRVMNGEVQETSPLDSETRESFIFDTVLMGSQEHLANDEENGKSELEERMVVTRTTVPLRPMSISSYV